MYSGPDLLTGEVPEWNPSSAQLIPLSLDGDCRFTKSVNWAEGERWKELRAQPCPVHNRKHTIAQYLADEGSLAVSYHTQMAHVQSEGRPPSPTEGLQTVSACTIHLQGMCEGGGAEWVM